MQASIETNKTKVNNALDTKIRTKANISNVPMSTVSSIAPVLVLPAEKRKKATMAWFRNVEDLLPSDTNLGKRVFNKMAPTSLP